MIQNQTVTSGTLLSMARGPLPHSRDSTWARPYRRLAEATLNSVHVPGLTVCGNAVTVLRYQPGERAQQHTACRTGHGAVGIGYGHRAVGTRYVHREGR